MCQDWDKTKFKASAGPARLLRPNLAEVTVRVDLGFDAPRQERMIFTKEGNGWRLDDLFHPGGFPHGLKQALRQAIVADEATRRRHT